MKRYRQYIAVVRNKSVLVSAIKNMAVFMTVAGHVLILASSKSLEPLETLFKEKGIECVKQIRARNTWRSVAGHHPRMIHKQLMFSIEDDDEGELIKKTTKLLEGLDALNVGYDVVCRTYCPFPKEKRVKVIGNESG